MGDSNSGKNSHLENLIKSLNANSILILAGFAALYYLSGVFITKEIYYRDQVRLESTLKEIKDSQNRLLEIVTRKEK